jgi:flotillin
MMTTAISTIVALAALVAFAIIIAVLFRTVVSTNDVHIVQSAKNTVSFGKGQQAGNVYYAWPYWVPVIGIRTIRLPVSVFNVSLKDYSAYDIGRVPFHIDIMAFFRIEDSNVAAQRVSTQQELHGQLSAILQGACRSILAQSDIEHILEGRSKFGQLFTEAVTDQLTAWGVVNVKSIELMDIRDAEGSKAIANIMEKKKSLIERDSRTTVAENKRLAQEAEIIAAREVSIRDQEAQEAVGIRTAAKEQAVGIAKEKSHQEIAMQAAITTEKNMAVNRVELVRGAEIERERQIVAADQQKQTLAIKAEGDKKQTVLIAEGHLQRAKLEAEGIQANGAAVAEADRLKQLASVTAQTTLAEKIGENERYQNYLLGVRGIEAQQQIGVAQAAALGKAQIKVIANAGSVDDGVKDARELLSSRGGTRLGAMVEAFAQTDVGKAVVHKLGIASEAK